LKQLSKESIVESDLKRPRVRQRPTLAYLNPSVIFNGVILRYCCQRHHPSLQYRHHVCAESAAQQPPKGQAVPTLEERAKLSGYRDAHDRHTLNDHQAMMEWTERTAKIRLVRFFYFVPQSAKIGGSDHGSTESP
jgi:hypothetical protein